MNRKDERKRKDIDIECCRCWVPEYRCHSLFLLQRRELKRKPSLTETSSSLARISFPHQIRVSCIKSTDDCPKCCRQTNKDGKRQRKTLWLSSFFSFFSWGTREESTKFFPFCLHNIFSLCVLLLSSFLCIPLFLYVVFMCAVMSDSVACNTPQTYASRNSWHAIYFSQTLFFYPLKHQHAHPCLGGHVVCLDEYVYVIYYHLGIMDYFVNLPLFTMRKGKKRWRHVFEAVAWQWTALLWDIIQRNRRERCRKDAGGLLCDGERVHPFFVILSLLKSSFHKVESLLELLILLNFILFLHRFLRESRRQATLWWPHLSIQ